MWKKLTDQRSLALLDQEVIKLCREIDFMVGGKFGLQHIPTFQEKKFKKNSKKIARPA